MERSYSLNSNSFLSGRRLE
jgi:hypothetical protein